MADREKAIRILEQNYSKGVFRSKDELMPVTDIIVLLKEQEPIEARLHLCESCTKEYPECDATIDGIEFGCGVGNDNIIGCTAYVNRWKAQEPVRPIIEKNISTGECEDPWGRLFFCGACGKRINEKYNPDEDDKYCKHCGHAVKWE